MEQLKYKIIDKLLLLIDEDNEDVKRAVAENYAEDVMELCFEYANNVLSEYKSIKK